MPHASKMWVVTVDKDGNQLGDGKWIDSPVPDSFVTDGFAQIESYVDRLLESSARFTSLIIGTPDDKMAISLYQRGGIPEFSVLVEWRQFPERERAIRQFFRGRNLRAHDDYLAGNGGVPDSTRCLGYVLPDDALVVTSLVKDILGQVYGLCEADGLNFAYEESE